MKQIQVKANLGDIVWFIHNNEIKSDKVHSIQVYNTCSWYYFFKKSTLRYKFYRRNDDYILKKEENIFLSKEELLKSLGN